MASKIVSTSKAIAYPLLGGIYISMIGLSGIYGLKVGTHMGMNISKVFHKEPKLLQYVVMGITVPTYGFICGMGGLCIGLTTPISLPIGVIINHFKDT